MFHHPLSAVRLGPRQGLGPAEAARNRENCVMILRTQHGEVEHGSA